MKKLILIFILFVTVSFGSDLFAQTTTIQGTVKNPEGVGVVRAIIKVKGPKLVGTVADLDGNYKLTVNQAPPFTIIISSLGYADVEQNVEASGTLDIVMSQRDRLGLSQVVVTGVANSKSKIRSSVSITTIKPNEIAQSAPRTTAEIFRTIPGIRSEASGGDGNTNITVRGVPISAGGSKYLQLQEDGLPIMLFGDIAFATSDIFLRADPNIARIEAIRGGAASTFSSNSPAGIINFISKTGTVEGGSIATTVGLDYNTTRTDFDYGAPLANGFRYHIGGFLRSGEGPRNAGYTANSGGQIKANITKNFKKGYARMYYKYLNDRTAAYMPMPIEVSGTNANPTWKSIDGFNATQDGLQSTFLQSNYGIGGNGSRRRVDVADGMHPLSNAIGAEFAFDLGNNWSVNSKSRFTTNSGRFVAPISAVVGTTADVTGTIGGALGRDLTGASLTYSDDGSPFTGGLAQAVHMFDTELENFNNIFSDTRITKSFNNDKILVTGGFFKGFQRINMSWHWNSYMMEVQGDNGRMIDIAMADSTQLSTGGQYAYGVPIWDNCCGVQYNATYDVSAPYASVELALSDKLNVESSFRYDMGNVTGVGSGGSLNSLDVNNNGVIEPIEDSVSTINLAQKNAVNYDYAYASFSVGANYQIDKNQAVFARISRGGSAKADRAIFPTDSYVGLGNPKDMITQAELGWKKRFKNAGLFVTAFYAGTTEEGGFEASTQKVIENDYTAFGLEIEGALALKKFDVRGALTYTKAEITSGDNMGNAPRRQPGLMYNVIPTYKFKNHGIGVSLIGQSKAYAQDNNELVMPGYLITSAFVNLGITKGLTLSLNGNNLLDSIGITESEEGSITEGQINYLRARSITGRSISCTLRYVF